MKKLLWALFFLVYACRSPGLHPTGYQTSGTYPVRGDFHEPIAVVVVERNGMIDVGVQAGSAFLVDKPRGIFATAEHVVDLETSYRLFFCGRAYWAVRILDKGVNDVGFMRIVGPFDFRDFPEPYAVASSSSSGETVFLRGIHPHPLNLHAGKVLHQIMEGYYGLKFAPEYEQEFVYDNLTGKLGRESLMPNSAVGGRDEDKALATVVERDLIVTMNEDHQISFGGLSGGPTVNAKMEVIGINSKQPNNEGDMLLDENGLNYVPRVTMKILPYDELNRALQRLKASNP